MSFFSIGSKQRSFFQMIHTRSWFFQILVTSLLVFPPGLLARTEIGLVFGQNHGKQIFETGSKIPDISGFAGGSRLTYARDFNYIGVELLLSEPGWVIQTGLRSTGWYVDSGKSRNEDFTLNERSQIRSNNLDLRKGRFRDTPYVISGSHNFADAYGRTAYSGYDISFGLSYYPFADHGRRLPAAEAQQKTTTGPSIYTNTGFFLQMDLRYSYFKYYVYDVVQYIRTVQGPYIAAIGYGNSFANTVFEYPLGIGYAWQWPNYRLETALTYVSGFNQARDFHKQRNITFITEQGIGDGFAFRIDGSFYPQETDYSIRLRLYGHRYYSKGTLHAEGGLNDAIFTTMLVTNQRVWLSTKEAGLEIGVIRKF